MSEEDQTVGVTALPKFDMPSYESEMTSKDVKSLALRHGIPLDLHPVVLRKGWTMDKLPDDMIGLYEYSKGPPLTSQDGIEQHTTLPLPSDQPILEKMDHQKEVEVEDPKIVAIRERKAKAATKKKKKKKRHGNDGGEGPLLKTKRRKTVARKDGPATSEATSSPEPIRIIDPDHAKPSSAVAATAELGERRSALASPRGSTGHSVHNYSGQHDDEGTDTLRLGTSGGRSDRALVDTTTEVTLMRVSHPRIKLTMCPNGSFIGDADWTASCGITDILERFEHLQTDFDRLTEEHAGCEDTV
ncbi:hypothetical protein Tco_1358266, partial [Tanacetum coccineum]